MVMACLKLPIIFLNLPMMTLTITTTTTTTADNSIFLTRWYKFCLLIVSSAFLPPVSLFRNERQHCEPKACVSSLQKEEKGASDGKDGTYICAITATKKHLNLLVLFCLPKKNKTC